MGRPSKEYQAFTNLIDRLLTVPKDEIHRRNAEHREKSAANPRKRGPKPKTTRPSKRFDLQAKTGSAIGPSIRLGPHSREPPEGDAINRPEPMPGLNHPRNSAIFTKHWCA